MVVDGDDRVQPRERGQGQGIGVDLQGIEQRADVAQVAQVAGVAGGQADRGAADMGVAGIGAAARHQDAAAARSQRDVAAAGVHARQQDVAAELGEVDVAGGLHGQCGRLPGVAAGQLLALAAQVDAQGAGIGLDHATGDTIGAAGDQGHVARAAQQRFIGAAGALGQDRPCGFQPHAAGGGDAARQQVFLVTHDQVAGAAEHHVAAAADRHHTAGGDVQVVAHLQGDAVDHTPVFHPLATLHHLQAVGRDQQGLVGRWRLGELGRPPAIHQEAALVGQVEGGGLAGPHVALVLHRDDVARAGLGQRFQRLRRQLVQPGRIDHGDQRARAADAAGAGLRHQADVHTLDVQLLRATVGGRHWQVAVREDGIDDIGRDRVLRQRQQAFAVGQASAGQLGFGEAGTADLRRHLGRGEDRALESRVDDGAVARFQAHVTHA